MTGAKLAGVTLAARASRWVSWLGSASGSGLLRLVAAGAGGAAVYAGFAPSTLWWAPIIGFALLGLALHGRRARVAAGLGFVFGAALFLPLLIWSGIYVGDLPWFALSLAEAALVMPATALVGYASRHLPAWPAWGACAWVGGEWLRAVFPFGGFPWGGVAFTQADGPLLPIAAVLGESGITVAVALAGFAVAELVRRLITRRQPGLEYDVSRGRRSVLVPLLLIAVPLLAGPISLPAVHSGVAAPTVPIGLVQGNVPEPGLEFNARRRAVLDMHAAETTRLAESVRAGDDRQPVFVLWPENASDIDPYRNADAARVIDEAVREVGVPILVGAVVAADEPDRLYNQGIVWDPVTGPGQTYTKRHPVPFGEYMPMRSFFRIFSDKVDLIRSEFLPGDRPGNLMIAGVPVGDVICFEIVDDGIVRDVLRGGAQVIVVQTNNATFGYTNETYQQQAMSRIRAVEHGRAVLIAATSGVSAVIGPDGSVTDTIPLFTAGFAVADVPLITATTAGTVLGAPVQYLLTIACPIAVAWRLLRARRGSRRSDVKGERAGG